MSDLSKQVGARIRAARLEMGLRTQRELAEKFESGAVNNQRISDWERGANRPSERYMNELAKITGKDVTWFYAPPENGHNGHDVAAGVEENRVRLVEIEKMLREVLIRLPAEIAREAARRRRDKPEPSAPAPAGKRRKGQAA